MRKHLLTSVLVLLLAACSKGQDTTSASAVDDSSASGSAAGAVGGALSGSMPNGTQAQMNFKASTNIYASLKTEFSPMPKASAADLCPMYFSSTGCSTTGSSSMWLSYNDCTFTGRVEWSGVQSLTMSSGTAACGTFPNPGANGTLYRQYVTAAGAATPGQVTLTAASKLGTIDDASANLANFDGDTITTISNGGYGVAVDFNAQDKRNQLTLGHHIAVTGSYDHSVTGTVSISEGTGSRTVNGSLEVFHNLLKVIGTSTFTNVIHDNTCCLPVGGTITTAFTAGASVAPTAAGSKYVGKSETLTLTGCGTATLQQTDGTTINVSLNRCF